MYNKVPAAISFLAIAAIILFIEIAITDPLRAQATSADTAQTDAAGGGMVDEALIEQGRTLFRENCQVCHQVHQQVVGPALANVGERRDAPWLISFIKNSQKVIQSGDEYAVQLYNQFNKTVMPSFDFKDEEILSILAYIGQESEAAPQAQAETPTTEAAPTTTGLPNQYVNIILIGILVVLILILVVLALIISTLTKHLSKQPGAEGLKTAGERMSEMKKFMISKPVLGILTFVFLALITKGVIDQLYSVGVQEGYAPEQPVWFSHKIHAGTYQIDCNYCHTSAQDSKNAGIPAVNVCMNCHDPAKSGITVGTITGETELKKVVDAYQNNEPIIWTRVHNLPDLAYFNHAQHANVGGVECQTCHGPVEEMDVITQSTTLTMGWCIDCHRTTPVNTKGNSYYDELVAIHSELDQPMMVANIGGTECSRCHY